MVNKLFTVARQTGAIAMVFVLINILDCAAKEYVFTAPPERGKEELEIPESESEYPLYECDAELAETENYISDSHDCTCTDCEILPEDSSLEPHAAPRDNNTE
ncbi:MAG: hypothetical protein AAFQ41_01430 [Cyanobacteria bacterium J06623_7]